ncbi:hypothetical protein ONZ45_g2007 [Pleurotus djamor]|nr:hypothetical protein ONZ45_g16371 [Pleurotus djamor]KAJ8521254.1 hypothetical protein ONZ45_g2007 [Pleurotus djamor]
MTVPPFVPLPQIRRTIPFSHRTIRFLLACLPDALKLRMYGFIHALATRKKWHDLHPSILRLPFSLVLKVSEDHSVINESAALKLLETENIQGINAPFLVDNVVGPNSSFLLSTFMCGDQCGRAMANEMLLPSDWDRLILDLRDQFESLHAQTISNDHVICNAAGLIPNDPRALWIAERNADVSSVEKFFKQIWIGLDGPKQKAIRPVIEPLIAQSSSLVFCHGDLAPRNLIFSDGLQSWRDGRSRVAIIDWEYAMWATQPWEALKSIVCVPYPDDEWVLAVRRIFPSSNAYLDAELLWRAKSGVMLI